MPLQGNLQEMSLASLIQVNCQEMRSARLVLTRAHQSGEIYFSDGQVVHATLGNLQGEEAVYALLTWDEGIFILERDVAAPLRTIALPWPTLLLEGMKRAVEQPREEKVMTQGGAMADDVITQLRAISGVEKVVLAAKDGILMDADVRDREAENQAAVTVFVGAAAQQLSNTLQLGTVVQGVITQKSRRLLILPQAEHYIGLVLAENVSPTLVANAASQVLRK